MCKITKHVHLKPLHIPVPGRRFSHIHVDLVGPLPSSGGCTYLFTIIDSTTWWAEAVPLAATSVDWHVLGCQPQSPLIEDHSTHQLCGRPSATC